VPAAGVKVGADAAVWVGAEDEEELLPPEHPAIQAQEKVNKQSAVP
jgi:hypothetical protein